MKKKDKKKTKRIKEGVTKDFEKTMEMVKKFPVKNIPHPELKNSVWTIAE